MKERILSLLTTLVPLRSLYYICFFCLLFCFGCSSGETAGLEDEERSAAKTDNSRSWNAFVAQCGTLEITPVDESAKDTSLLRFITCLKKVVAEKNTKALLRLLDEDVVSSHGGGLVGETAFTEDWHLQHNPSESLLWPKLERAMALGGCFDKDINKPAFVMPYLQASHYFKNGCDFDWYNTYICLKPATKLYEFADAKSTVLAELTYRMLETDEGAQPINSFIPVHTIGKTIKGYVHENEVYLCADYMLVIDKREGSWIIKEFVPYD